MAAREISSEEAIQGVREFLSGQTEALKGLRVPSAKTAAASIEIADVYDIDGKKCLYVVNYDGGFAIVSADTRLPEILGYSDGGAYDESRLSPNFRWWIGEYAREISARLPYVAETEERPATRMADRAQIAPMLKTKWDQGAPYNNTCPMDTYGQRSVTGCVATAMAQVMKYHQWPDRPTGTSGGITFTGSTFDWGNMLDEYVQGKYTSTQAGAVAQLMRYCGASVDMMYSSYASGAYDYHVPYSLRTYFGYASDIQMVWKDYTQQRNWNNIVYNELAAKRPVLYTGNSSQGGHAFVCDGYQSNEYFHFNWGWGGYQDGYFLLTALNPLSGGAGSYEGGYNSNQSILTGVRKSSGEKGTQNALLSTGSFVYENGSFKIADSIIPGYEMIYNPLYNAQTLTFGLCIKNSDNSGTPKYVAIGDKVTLNSMYGTTEFTGTVPSQPNGTYHISAVFTVDGTNWLDVQIPLGKQSYVTMTVSGGKQTFANPGPDPEMMPNLIMAAPDIPEAIYASGQKALKIPFINTGKGDYLGEIGVSLFGDDEFGDVVSAANNASIPGESFAELEFVSPDKVKAGRYRLYVFDGEGNTLSEDYYIDIKADPDKIPASATTTADNLAPSYYTQGVETILYGTFNNNSSLPFDTKLKVMIKKAADSKPAASYTTTQSMTMQPGIEQRIAIGPIVFDLPAGEYYWYFADDKENRISEISPLVVTSEIKKVANYRYIVTDAAAKKAILTGGESSPYTGQLTVPATLGGYSITALRQDAFAFSSCTQVRLPAAISDIPNGGFYNAYNLRRLLLDYDGIASRGDQTFREDAMSTIWMGVPQEHANIYGRDESWSMFKYPNYKISAENGSRFENLDLDPATGEPYNPYYMNPETALSVRTTAPEGMNVTFEWGFAKTWSGGTIDPTKSTLEIPAISWNNGLLSIKATNQQVSVQTVDSDTYTGPVYSVDGRLVMENGTTDDIMMLEPGIYVHNGRKVIVR